MPLWNGSSLNTNALSLMFNQLWSMESVNIVSKRNGLLYKILGKGYGPRTDRSHQAFNRVGKANGNRLEVRLLGKLTAISTVSDGANELATAPLAYAADTFGAAQFDLTHYNTVFGVPASEFERIKGDEAKTKSFVSEKTTEIAMSLENTWGTAINTATAGGSRTVMGNWLHAVSDGINTGGVDETAFASYGTIDRADVDNLEYRGIVARASGAISLASLRTQITQIRVNNGNPTLALMPTALYNATTQILENKVTVFNKEDWGNFGGEVFTYAGVDICLEQRAPTGTVGLFDTSTWVFWNNNPSAILDGQAMIQDPSRRSARVIPVDAWTQLVCVRPNANAKMLGVTSA